jgi:two-component system sensor histidine kinase KdpD
MSYPTTLTRKPTWITRLPPYLYSLLFTAVTVAALVLARPYLTAPVAALLLLIPVSLSAAAWGLGPSILAGLLAFIALNYFFISPLYTLTVHQAQDLLALLVFLGVAALISQLVGRMRDSLALAEQREHESRRLYEMSGQLGQRKDEGQILQYLADYTQETTLADQVETLVTQSSNGKPLLVSTPPIRPHPIDAQPDLVISLLGTQYLLGEMRLWRERKSFSETEMRLLQTYASLAAVTLERARLAQESTRAQILEESDRLKSALLSSVSHELRTPLATIKAAITSLSSGTVPWESDARSELVAVIDEEADQLNRLVGNLLNMSRIEAGALQLQRQWTAISDCLAAALRRSQTASRDHPIQIDLPDDLPLAWVDDVLIEQVFSNLISNSGKYSPPGTPIEIHAASQGGGLVVTVINRGPHVAEPDLGRIFEKFQRLTAADRVTGTGLGLSICKGIVEAHGGTIWAENLPDGFAFHFTLSTSPLSEQPVEISG